jgi:hypothetical protein
MALLSAWAFVRAAENGPLMYRLRLEGRMPHGETGETHAPHDARL